MAYCQGTLQRRSARDPEEPEEKRRQELFPAAVSLGTQCPDQGSDGVVVLVDPSMCHPLVGGIPLLVARMNEQFIPIHLMAIAVQVDD
jgi:hypothetical protein